MKLSEHLRPLSFPERERLAVASGTTWHHLKNVAFSRKACGEKLAVALEHQTSGAVRRWDLRADDWWLIWPELIGAAGAPEVPAGDMQTAGA
jgi:hypothetical protein